MLYLVFLAPDALSTAFTHAHVTLRHKTLSHAHGPGTVFPMLQNVPSAERKNTMKFIERANADIEVFTNLLASIY